MRLNLFIAILMLLICSHSFSQIPPTYRFRKPTALNATTWKFTNVTAGVDAIVSITASKNATLTQIDDSSVYAYAWNPRITYTNTMNNSTDSSYIEFTINFVKTSNNAIPSVQSTLAMTIVDCDGTNTYQEMVKTSVPTVSKVISGSSLKITEDSRWLTAIGGKTDYAGMDTSIYAAMTELDFVNLSSFKMRVGVLGKIPANTMRLASFYFKPFNAMAVPLAVELSAFGSELKNGNPELSWSTSSETNLNRFDVYRSTDGYNYLPVGSVNANVNSTDLINYSFTDYNVININSPFIYYRLKMVNMDGTYKLSNISQLKVGNLSKSTSVVVFPNPCTESVNVELSAAPESDITFSIVDVYGKTVQTIDNPSMTASNVISFDVRNFENGIYFMNILNGDGSSTSNNFMKR